MALVCPVDQHVNHLRVDYDLPLDQSALWVQTEPPVTGQSL